jgi:TusA-related sulfurtransferase
MKKQLQFNSHELLDPFSLLKVQQVLREISCGESLELICKGGKAPDELFKVLPTEEYEIVERESHENPLRCRIVIKKRKAPSGPDHREGGWGCSCS